MPPCRGTGPRPRQRRTAHSERFSFGTSGLESAWAGGVGQSGAVAAWSSMVAVGNRDRRPACPPGAAPPYLVASSSWGLATISPSWLREASIVWNVREGRNPSRHILAWAVHGEMSKVVRLPASREALSLYRDILRVARNFKFPNEQGELWFGQSPELAALAVAALTLARPGLSHGVNRSDVIVRSARQEFEQARYEKVGALLPLPTARPLTRHLPSLRPRAGPCGHQPIAVCWKGLLDAAGRQGGPRTCRPRSGVLGRPIHRPCHRSRPRRMSWSRTWTPRGRIGESSERVAA